MEVHLHIHDIKIKGHLGFKGSFTIQMSRGKGKVYLKINKNHERKLLTLLGALSYAWHEHLSF